MPQIGTVERIFLFSERQKQIENQITLASSFHPALNQLIEILKKAHQHVNKSPLLQRVLLKPPRVVFRNSKTLRNKLVRSKLKINLATGEGKGCFECGDGSKCQICKILKRSNEFTSSWNSKKLKILIF